MRKKKNQNEKEVAKEISSSLVEVSKSAPILNVTDFTQSDERLRELVEAFIKNGYNRASTLREFNVIEPTNVYRVFRTKRFVELFTELISSPSIVSRELLLDKVYQLTEDIDNEREIHPTDRYKIKLAAINTALNIIDSNAKTVQKEVAKVTKFKVTRNGKK